MVVAAAAAVVTVAAAVVAVVDTAAVVAIAVAVAAAATVVAAAAAVVTVVVAAEAAIAIVTEIATGSQPLNRLVATQISLSDVKRSRVSLGLLFLMPSVSRTPSPGLRPDPSAADGDSGGGLQMPLTFKRG